MSPAGSRNFLLYLKALIWSIFVSYKDSTISIIIQCLREGSFGEHYPELKDTHLGDGIRLILESLPREEDRILLATSLERVKQSEPAMVYRNMVIEVGHYVTLKAKTGDVPENCYGVVYCLKSSQIHVLFRKTDGTLSDQCVHPFQILPVYTLTVPDNPT